MTHNANLHILHPKKRALIKDWLLNGITSTEIAADRLSGHLMEKRLYLFPKRICASLLLLLGMGPLLDLTSDRVYNAGYEMAQTTIGIGSPEGTTADPRGTAGYKAAETSSGGSDDMKVIIIGAGEVGYHIADILSREGSDTVVIDKNEERLHEISEALDIHRLSSAAAAAPKCSGARTWPMPIWWWPSRTAMKQT